VKSAPLLIRGSRPLTNLIRSPRFDFFQQELLPQKQDFGRYLRLPLRAYQPPPYRVKSHLACKEGLWLFGALYAAS